jgi:hypothetical protein
VATPPDHANDSTDPERVELELHAFSVRTILLVTDPWASAHGYSISRLRREDDDVVAYFVGDAHDY